MPIRPSRPKHRGPERGSELSGNLAADSATLGAFINPNFADTTYYFEYVDAADYNPAATDPYSAGADSPSPPGTDIGSSNTDQVADVDLSGLRSSTTYHWRVVAINAVGTTDGPDQTFTTPTPAAPSIDQEKAFVGGGAAQLSAEINPNADDTTYYFEYVDAADYDPTASDPYSAGTQDPLPPGTDIGSENTDQSESVLITGLAQTTTYHWRVVAINAEGTTYGADQTFEEYPYAPAVDSEAPSEVGASTATLTAEINPELADTSYYFEYVDAADYNPSASDPYTAGTQAPTAPGADIPGSDGNDTAQDQLVTENLTELTAGTTYDYRAIAANALGTTYGPDQTFTTYMVTTDAAQDVTQAGAILTGTLDRAGTDMMYEFQYGPTTAYGIASPRVS